MEKKFIVLNSDGEHDYDITVIETEKGVEYSLYKSSGQHWRYQHQGELTLKMINTGNEIKFDRKIGKEMDYCDVLELHLLLSLERCLNPEFKYQIFENKTIVEV